MEQKNPRPNTYIGLINRFWRLDEIYQFSPAETRVFFYLLKIANVLAWPSAFPHADKRAAANCGISLAAFKAARNTLSEAGVISYTPGGAGHAKKTMYRICKCNEYQESEQAPRHMPSKPAPATKSTPAYPTKAAPVSVQPQVYVEEPRLNAKSTANKAAHEGQTLQANSNPTRNTEGLLRNLQSLQASQEDIDKLLILSNHGEIGHPIWQLIYEAKNSNGAIKQPVRFIFSRLLPSTNAVTN